MMQKAMLKYIANYTKLKRELEVKDMLLLSIDPASYYNENSTTGAVLLDGIKLVDSFVVEYGPKGVFDLRDKIRKRGYKVDKVICEKYEVRAGDSSADNSVLETIEVIKNLFDGLGRAEVELFRNAGYQSDVPDKLLKILGLYQFDKSHHNDVRAAARLAIFYYMRNGYQNEIDAIGDEVLKKWK